MARSDGNFRRRAFRSSIYTHPYLMVWKADACTGCSGAITAEFTWQASQQELDKALDFNLSCITEFRDCKTVEEYLPSAAELLFRDGKQYVSWDSIPCDSRMARILGRDSDFVGIVRLTKLGQPDDNFVIADYQPSKASERQSATTDRHLPVKGTRDCGPVGSCAASRNSKHSVPSRIALRRHAPHSRHLEGDAGGDRRRSFRRFRKPVERQLAITSPSLTMSAVSSTFRAHYCMHSKKSAISLS